MRLRIYYERNLTSYFISKILIKNLRCIPKFDFLKINIRHWKEKEYASSRLIFWVLLFLSRQRPRNIRTWCGGLLMGFFVTLRGKQLFLFLDKFVNFILPLNKEQAILTASMSPQLYTKYVCVPFKYKYSYVFTFLYKGLQEYFEFLPFIQMSKNNVSISFLRDLRFFFTLSIFTWHSYASINLIHMCRLPLKFRV